ncbi:MAG TPA: ABC transporter ATP-binding protein [Stellaceae bacterium]|nr:ABC transporter ATP-binding protein [Stellaceae bacterium]
MTERPEAAPAVECRGIHKRFGAIRANDGVDLAVARGHVHGIIGENGAGKSTLMGLLYGHFTPDAGEVRIRGQPVRFRSPKDAIAGGIGMVHQHFVLVETFTVLENLLLGCEEGPLLRSAAQSVREDLSRFAADFDLALDPDAIAGTLPVGLRQRLEILKALRSGADILILDEPTAVLTPQESERLFAVLRRLAGEGRTVLLVTHKLKDVLAVTDRVGVMRAGRIVATLDTAATDAERLAELMIGRRLSPRESRPHPTPPPQTGEGGEEAAPVLEVEGLTAPGLHNVSFSVGAGEIVGIAGVAGNGQSELLAAIAGMIPMRGSLRITGHQAAFLDVDARRALGLAHIPEDRLGMALIAEFTAEENAILGDQRRPPFARGWLSAPGAITEAARRRMEEYDVRPAEPKASTGTLSGGNQQKLVCAREMGRRPLCLVVGQPTRGVDIAASDFIHRRLLALKEAGTAILLVSADLDEIRALADRVLVMEGGLIAGALGPEASERELGLLMGGGRAR